MLGMVDDPNNALYAELAREHRRTSIILGVIVLLGTAGMAMVAAKRLGLI
jgi:hypothetical protein